jgi:D-glycero-alpha-D-manno-heptose-7-phosphate kinase
MLIISNCPLRISLVGGGSDLPEVSSKIDNGGCSVGFSINFQMTLVSHPYVEGIRLKYSEIEDVRHPSEIRHNIAREVLVRLFPSLNNIEIASLCDVPGGTGLGSSSAYTVALINLIHKFMNKKIEIHDLAYKASEAEIEWCGRSIGLQDQFHCSHGGVNLFNFDGMKQPAHKIIKYNEEWNSLEASPFLIVKIPGLHDSNLRLMNASNKINDFSAIRGLVESAVKAVESDQLSDLAEIVYNSWQYKKNALPDECNLIVDSIIESSKQIDPKAGGKLLGSGGGGYVLIISEHANKLLNFFGNQAKKVSVNIKSAQAEIL